MGITIVDVTYIKVLKESESSSIFQVSVEGKICVLKVYHSMGKSHADPPDRDREVDTFTCESVAYRRLKSKGLCQQGVVPDIYGVIERIDPSQISMAALSEKLSQGRTTPKCYPHGIHSKLTTNRPFDIFRKRIAKLRTILKKIHEVRIYHDDPYPRNMMVQKDTSRVLWIDFDRAQTFSEGYIVERKWQWMEDEEEMIDEFLDALTEDYMDGKISRTWPYYYEYA
ncbi:hypothetical protein V1525DRAFT_243922 [Lipomyces kononenkoae]|uniref:Uncharacterized protein n=1 Tax=Lipomyces kononenkoae TaxID=34357 RepID=A0ACC3SW13_LIPKO